VETSLLATKIGIPPERPRLVSRARLLERLHDGLGYCLVLISAPAGFGKTTLLSDWLARDQLGAQTSWLSLDEGDSDPARFWEYFIAALRTLRPGVGEVALAALHSPQPLPAQSVLVPLINELLGGSQDLVLVLDDYQFIKSEDIHSGVSFLLEHMPPRMHLVVATRADPPLPLAHLRGRGMMLEIGADDLRFTLDEAADLLRELRGAELLPEDVNALNLRTEGWAVGLKMAALSLGRQEDVPAFIAAFTGSQRYIMDYLIEEVLQKQTTDVQNFLLRTSVLEKLTAPLCDALTGRTDGRNMLQQLERANLFVVPLDEPRSWYRYEHLFAELLRHQLDVVSGKKVVADLHCQASDWYERSGLFYEAINHSLAAQDWARAMSLLSDVSERQKETGEMITLLGWLRAIPEDRLRSNPRLCCNYSVALLFTGQLDAADAVLSSLEPTISEDTEALGRVVATRAVIASFRGDLRRTAELAHAALPLLSPADLDAHSALSVNLGKLYSYYGFYKEAESLLREGSELARQTGQYWAASVALSLLSDISHWRGRLRQAVGLCEEALELSGQSPAAAMPHYVLGTFLYELNDLESATFHLNKALEFNQLMGLPEVQEVAYCYLLRVSLAQGDEAGTLIAMEKLGEVLASDGSPFDRARRAGYQLFLALTRGDMTGASQWGDRLAHFGDLTPFYFRPLLMYLLITQGRSELVPEQIRAFHQGVPAEWLSPETGWSITARLYQALSVSEPDEALRLLGEALVAAEPEGWTRTFVDQGASLVPLLQKAVSHGIAPEYAARLLTIIEFEESRRAKGRKHSPLTATYGLLTNRELEVLRLLAAGLSNRQIAERLFISVSTAKVHVHNISEKLNATSRTRAIARARELNLI
jgi:ATP/maltotriose-dependent transcriptional regulator MalT